MSRWETISITAHYTAQAWIAQGLPLSSLFDTLEGKILYRLVQPLFMAGSRLGFTTPPEFLFQRHALMDWLLQRHAPQHVFELACGLSPRALSYCLQHQVDCFDIDLSPIIQKKTRLLAGYHLPPRYHLVEMDLIATEDYAQALGPAFQPHGPAVILAEGLLIYFSPQLRQQIFCRVADLLRRAGGGTFLFDMHHQQEVDQLGVVARFFRIGLHRLSRTKVEPMIQNEREGEHLLCAAGYDQVLVHRPRDWSQRLSLPLRGLDSGLCVYEASIFQ